MTNFVTVSVILSTWKEYGAILRVTDQRTIEKRLRRLGIVIPPKGAPIMAAEAFIEIVKGR